MTKSLLLRLLRKFHHIDFIEVEGLIRIRELPADCTEGDFNAWWPRLTEKEKDRYTVQRFHNILTTIGKTTLLTYMSTLSPTNGNVTVPNFGFSQALGNGVVSGIFATDTTLFGQVVNKQITSASVSATQLDYSTFFVVSDFSNTTVTNGGIFGGASNQLLTHFACNYTKGSLPFTFDYLLSLP